MRLTGILNTFGRGALLLQNMAFIAKYSFPVLILDATPEPDAAIVEQIKAKANVTYLHAPGMSPNERHRLALQHVATPYVICLSDDDRVLPETVLACVDFLDAHPGHVAAQGSFWVRQDGDPQRPYLLEVYSPSLEQADPCERLAFHGRHYAFTVYGVQRTEAFARCVDNSRLQAKPQAFWELTMSFSLVGLGKVRCLHQPIGLREPNSVETLERNYTTHPAFWKKKDPEEFATFEGAFLNDLPSRPPFAGPGGACLERAYRDYLIGTMAPEADIVQVHKYYLHTLEVTGDATAAMERLVGMTPQERAPLRALEDSLRQFVTASPLWNPLRYLDS